MSATGWKRVDAIFAGALSLPEAERPEYVARACGADAALRAEVEALLEGVEAAEAYFDARAPELLLEQQGLLPPPAASEGHRIGPYRLVRLLGEGGMGAVYLAERADGEFDRRVAIKLVHPARVRGRDVIDRFLRERQILARLEHPSIARLHDGGLSDDGWPYLVMEHIEGLPIDAFCDANRLPVRDRIRLLQEVGRAVQYAHRNLVIHRDLKPSNILVTAEGVPKLLDFGIAKLLEDDAPAATQTDVRPMTPAYAAPEQVRGEGVTTATDMYALGVLLHELLTGQRPGEPAAPAPRALAGDLGRICLMALRPEPERRYESAQALVDDLQRYLDGRPVVARPDTLAYRARKFISRHRAGVAAAVLVSLSLVGGLAASMRQSGIARAEATKAREVSDFVLGLFEMSDPELASGEEVSVRDLLERGARRIESELARQPGVQAEMYSLIGPIHARLGLYDDGREMLTRAVELQRSVSGPGSEGHAAATYELARLEHRAGQAERAEALYRSARDWFGGVLGPRSVDVARVERDLARLLARRNRYAEADSLFASARETLAAAGAAEAELVLLDLDHVELAHAMGDAGRADSIYARILRGRSHLDEERSLTLASVMMRLGIEALHRGDVQRAEPLIEGGLELRRQVYGDGHADVGLAMAHLAMAQRALGRLDQALETQRQAVDILRETLGPDHPEYAMWLGTLGVRVSQDGDVEGAIAIFEEVERIQAAAGGDRHGLAMTRRNLARSLMSQGRWTEALPRLEAGLSGWIAAMGEDDFYPWQTRLDIALTLAELDERERADSLVEVVVARLVTDPPRGTRLGDALVVKARLRARDGRFDEAAEVVRSAVADYDARGLPERDMARAGAEAALGAYLVELGDLAAAEPLLLRAHRTFGELRGPRSEHAVSARERLVRLYEAWDRPEDAARITAGRP